MRIVLALLLLPAAALACGGLFCDQAQPVPIDQVREQVLFEVNPDNTVTTTVGIRYVGDSQSFSWVVPVPAQPTLEVVPASALELLDAATQPRIIPPRYVPNWGDDDVFSDDDDAGDDDDAADDDDATDSPVNVEDLPQVGPFDPQWITSSDPGALIDWLNDNGYLITAAMEPYVADYVASGVGFLGLKLAPDAAVTDIAPISMTYPALAPSLPIKLTSVSAAPQLELEIFVAGPSAYASANYVNLRLDLDDIRMDPRDFRTNYFELAAWRIGEAGGQALVTEVVQATNTIRSWANTQAHPYADQVEARQWLDEALADHPVLTRFTSRIDNTAMTSDPSFVPAANDWLDRTRDLRFQPDVTDDTGFAPCGTSYCGAGRCAARAFGAEGCLCDEGFNARAADRPVGPFFGGGQRLSCVDASFDLMRDVQVIGPSACDFTTCENGTCEVVAGFATCRCDNGRAAFPTAEGMSCLTPDAVFEPDQLLWPEVLDDFWPDGGTDSPTDIVDPGLPPGLAARAPGLGCNGASSASGIERLQSPDEDPDGCARGAAAALLLALPLGLRRRR